MSAPPDCFGACLQMLRSHERTSKDSFDKCVNGSLRTLSSKTSPTHSGSRLARLVLLIVSAAPPPHSQTPSTVPPPDAQAVKRWALAGDPHGVAGGTDGTLSLRPAPPPA